MSLPYKKRNKNQSGQALIIILLAMSVALTLVLSSVSRSVTDIEITDKEEESLRAFSAAEAGVEKALLEFTRGGGYSGEESSLTGQLQTTTTFETDITTSAVGSVYEYPQDLRPGEVATFWFAGHTGSGQLTCEDDSCMKGANFRVCYGDPDETYSDTPAIEVQVYYDDSATDSNDSPNAMDANNYSNVKVQNLVFDTVENRSFTGDNGGNNCNIDGYNSLYDYRSDVVGINSIGNCSNNWPCIIAVKVKSLYADQPVPVIISTAGDSPELPAQGVVINSTGTSGESQRKLNVRYNFSSIPSIFNNTVFSGGDLEK